jgi:hypothetical protein
LFMRCAIENVLRDCSMLCSPAMSRRVPVRMILRRCVRPIGHVRRPSSSQGTRKSCSAGAVTQAGSREEELMEWLDEWTPQDAEAEEYDREERDDVGFEDYYLDEMERRGDAD